MIICFQYENEAKKIYELMKIRLKQAGLEFAEDKTRLIEFGRFAMERRNKRGLGKTETFDFLGFTHYCGKSKNGKFRVKRKTCKKKFKQKVQEYKMWIKQNRNGQLKNIIITTKKKLTGHYNYYGITDNIDSIRKYHYCINKLLFKWLNRRSQRKSYTPEQFKQMLKVFELPKPTIKVKI